ncbi:hypothetical protein [Cytobacillus praedii]|uniref:hypothetical protein n=1 Tax=Cytobacillus praedii TaxID=1742358 RepID=UPI002E1FDE34|nr:hypothetical protein [Cytobacillus praedii]
MKMVLKRNLYLIGSVLVGLYLVVFVSGIFINMNSYQAVDYAIVLVFLVFLVILESFLIKKLLSYNNNQSLQREIELRKERKKLTPGSNARIKDLGADVCLKLKHVSGLPINTGTNTFVYRCSDKIIFERNEHTFELEIDKITDVSIKTNVQIHKGWVQGNRDIFAREKTSKTYSYLLIFAYGNGNEVNYITFDVTKNSDKASIFVGIYDYQSRERNIVKL